MPYTVTKYPQGTFSWADMLSDDVEKSRAFFEGLFGWTSEDTPTPMGMDYTTFKKDGHAVCGLSPKPDDMNGVPSHFSNYITVDNLDEMVAKAEKAGGTVIMPKMDVMSEGRMAGIKDPSGAAVMFWQAGNTKGAELVNTVGAMGWNELHTNDIEKAQAFYTEVFGWEYETDDDGYTTIKNNGRMNGGMMKIRPEWGDVPPSWITFFTVENIKDTLEKAKELGGTAHSEVIDAGEVGKMAVIAEPTGAVFTAIELKVPAEEWIE